MFTQFQKLSYAGPHTSEGGNENPEPPDFASGRIFSRKERSDYEAKTPEKSAYSVLNPGSFFILATSLSQALAMSPMYSIGALTSQLAPQRL
jgi:hypothetical protein